MSVLCTVLNEDIIVDLTHVGGKGGTRSLEFCSVMPIPSNLLMYCRSSLSQYGDGGHMALRSPLTGMSATCVWYACSQQHRSRYGASPQLWWVDPARKPYLPVHPSTILCNWDALKKGLGDTVDLQVPCLIRDL